MEGGKVNFRIDKIFTRRSSIISSSAKKNKNIKISSSNKNHKVIIFSIIFQMIFFLCPLSSLFIFGAKNTGILLYSKNFSLNCIIKF